MEIIIACIVLVIAALMVGAAVWLVVRQRKETELMQQRLTTEFENIANKVLRQHQEDFTQQSSKQIGDMLTQFDPDSGEALYRCSLGSDFYRGPQKAETSPIQEGMGRMGKRSRRRTIQPQRKSVGEGVASTLILERSSLVGGPGKADQLMVRR